MIGGDIFEQVGRLGDGSGSASRAWSWIAWAQLGFDTALAGQFAHSCLAIRELWGIDLPVPQALEQFRRGFADHRQGRRRPELRGFTSDTVAEIAAMVDQLRWIVAKADRLPRVCADDTSPIAFETRPEQRWACRFCPRSGSAAWQWMDAEGARWWMDMCDVHFRLFGDAVKLTNELFPDEGHHLAMADRTVHLEPCDGRDVTCGPDGHDDVATKVRKRHSLLAA